MSEPTLKRGSGQHDWINYAKKLLDQHFIRPGSMQLPMDQNGVFDEELERMVTLFQEQQGLGVDGKIGPNTWTALKRAAEAATSNWEPSVEDQRAERRADEMANHPHDPTKTDGERYHVRQSEDGPVKVYDMAAEEIDVTPGAVTDWNDVVTHMITRARQNVHDQVPWVHQAVAHFSETATSSIQQWAAQMERLEALSHANLPWDLLVDGLDTALGMVFTGPSGLAGWAYGKLKSAVIDGLVSELTAKSSVVSGLEAQLLAGVHELRHKVDSTFEHVIAEFETDGPTIIKEQMREHTQVSNNSDWIDEMVAWFGFPRKSTTEIKAPIQQWLDHQLTELLRAASDQVLAG